MLLVLLLLDELCSFQFAVGWSICLASRPCCLHVVLQRHWVYLYVEMVVDTWKDWSGELLGFGGDASCYTQELLFVCSAAVVWIVHWILTLEASGLSFVELLHPGQLLSLLLIQDHHVVFILHERLLLVSHFGHLLHPLELPVIFYGSHLFLPQAIFHVDVFRMGRLPGMQDHVVHVIVRHSQMRHIVN